MAAFNEQVYLQNKLDQLNNDPAAKAEAARLGWTGGSTADLKNFMGAAGMTAEQHYNQYGKAEGLNAYQQAAAPSYAAQVQQPVSVAPKPAPVRPAAPPAMAPISLADARSGLAAANAAMQARGTSMMNPAYRQPDWIKASAGAATGANGIEAQERFFMENPQYLEDYKTIMGGGLSSYVTDNTSLIRSDFSKMPKEVAEYYAKNIPALMGYEGMGADPVIGYMAARDEALRKQVLAGNNFLTNNHWDGNGIVAGRPGQMGSLGSGTQSYLDVLARMNGEAPPSGGGLLSQAPYNSGITGGSNGYGGAAPNTSYSGSSSSSSTGVTRDVNAPKETIEGRVNNLLATDANGNYTNPLIQQAASTAMQQFAGRGLLNSSMAQQAAYQAALSQAIAIAGPDAQTYFTQGRANQDAQNVFTRDESQYGYDMGKLTAQQRNDLERLAMQNKYDQQSQAMSAENQMALERLRLQASSGDRSANAVYTAYMNYMEQTQAILNAGLSPEATAERINRAADNVDNLAQAMGINLRAPRSEALAKAG